MAYGKSPVLPLDPIHPGRDLYRGGTSEKFYNVDSEVEFKGVKNRNYQKPSTLVGPASAERNSYQSINRSINVNL